MDAPTAVTQDVALATWTTLFSQTVHGVKLDQLFGSDLKTIKKWARSRPTGDEKILVTRAAKLILNLHEATEQILEMGLSPITSPSTEQRPVPVQDDASRDSDELRSGDRDDMSVAQKIARAPGAGKVVVACVTATEAPQAPPPPTPEWEGFSDWMIDQKGFSIDIWPMVWPVLASLSRFSGVQAMVTCIRCTYTIIALPPTIANMTFLGILSMVLLSVVLHPELPISMIFWILRAVPGYIEWAGAHMMQHFNDDTIYIGTFAYLNSLTYTCGADSAS